VAISMIMHNTRFGGQWRPWDVVAMNSDSHDDSAIVSCFCVLQLIGDSP
ncbi:hypothetical protein Tco_1527028, partial [Tanacetum coccineum]